MSWAVAGAPSRVEFVHTEQAASGEHGWMQVGNPVQTMLTPDGHRVWVGDGAPTVVFGAQVGDLYLDSASGMLYRLD